MLQGTSDLHHLTAAVLRHKKNPKKQQQAVLRADESESETPPSAERNTHDPPGTFASSIRKEGHNRELE